MTLDQIKDHVLRCLDEQGCSNNSIMYEQFPLDQMIAESAKELLLIAPSHVFLNPVDFSKNNVTKNTDGSGYISLPDKFIRLLQFRMKGWLRPVTKAFERQDRIYSLQFNPDTRGGIAKPIAIRIGKELHYFSLEEDSEHIVQEALCVIDVPPDDTTYPDNLIAPLVWLTASKILFVTGEPQLAKNCADISSELIQTL